MKFLGVISLRAEMNMTKNLSMGLRMNRIVSGYNKDEDVFLIGVEKDLK